MSAPRITLAYSGTTGLAVDDPYWIRIDQEAVADDIATVSDAAELIDAAYSIDACDKDPEPVTEDPQPEQLADAVAETVKVVSCDYDADGNVDVFLHIVRSTIKEPYRLQLRGGVVKLTEVVNGPITVVQKIESGYSLTLPYPVLGGFSVAWQGAVYGDKGTINPPAITRIGNTIGFGASIKSATIKATYQTQYDRVTVTVLGTKEGKPGECRALAFLHGLVDVHDCELPRASEVDETIFCQEKWQGPSSGEVTCYKIVRTHYTCSCSDIEMDVTEVEVDVECPSNDIRCPGSGSEDCRNLVGTDTVTKYVECPGDRTGTFDADLSSSAFYLATCCNPPPRGLPSCSITKTTYSGNYPVNPSPDFYRGLYGDLARFVAVSPPGGICGEMVIEQRIMGSNCCAEVQPLAWDDAVAPEVVSPGTTTAIGVTGGGKYAYVWQVAGEGFVFNNGAKKITTNGNQTILHVQASACGSAVLTISDGCSVAMGYLRSTAGQWVLTQQGFIDCPIMGDCSADYLGSLTWEIVKGNSKIRQIMNVGDLNWQLYPSPAAAQIGCGDRYNAELAVVSALRATDPAPSRFSKCFHGAPYLPCMEYQTVGNIDPMAITSCHEAAFGYTSGVGAGSRYANAHYLGVVIGYLYEWRC